MALDLGNDDSMAGPRLANLVPFFTAALSKYQRSSSTFNVLCSLPATADLAPTPPNRAPKNVYVLDSSFNPPTVAHKRMVISALSGCQNPEDSRILLLLAINNADKAPKPAAFPQRLAMMYLLGEDLLASTNELGGDGGRVDIAVTTEPYFHSKSRAVGDSGFYAKAAGGAPELVYLTGFDTLIRIFNNKYYPEGSMPTVLDPFFACSSLRVTMRTDADWGDRTEQVRYLDELRAGKLDEIGGKSAWTSKVEMVEGRQEGEEIVSSTKVRGAVRQQDWEALNKLVSDPVSKWIQDQKLYREES